ncbi:hypothetical protein, partial [Stenotrophomonas sp. PS02298]|uniref:hypothetical protein n=1 Tax=Stenotrophomonas sp. PS02298 TaxID=2991424 RepID=UPI00249CC680
HRGHGAGHRSLSITFFCCSAGCSNWLHRRRQYRAREFLHSLGQKRTLNRKPGPIQSQVLEQISL